MKLQVGDLVLIKNIRPRLRLRPCRCPRTRPRLLLRLNNTYGIITEVEKHSEIFESGSTESDNGYIWHSQVDGKEYHFYEDEVDGEVVK